MNRPVDLQVTLEISELASIGVTLTRAELTRGLLVTGSTGSGKTASVLMPILNALLREREAAAPEHRSAVVVIDPKRELAPHVLAACESVHVIGGSATAPIDVFGAVKNLTAGVLADRYLSLGGGRDTGLRDGFWQSSARDVLRDCIELDVHFFETADSLPHAHLRRSSLWRHLARAFQHEGRLSTPEARLLKSTRQPVSRYLTLMRLLTRESGQGSSPATSSGQLVLKILAEHAPDLALPALWRLPELASETSTSIVATAAALLAPLASARVQNAVRLDVLPPLHSTQRLSLQQCVERGEVVVYQPADLSEESAAIGRALKSAVYDAVLAGAACLPDGRPQRLAALVIDEWQMVVTTTGVPDQAYLEKARALGAVTVLASQGVSAIRDRLPERSTDALRAMLNNLATRIQLATTDPETIGELRALLPPPPVEGPHVLDVRSPAQFLPGMAVFIAPGKWGMGQVDLASSPCAKVVEEVSESRD